MHEEMETGHVDAAEEAVDLSVRALVQVLVVPESGGFVSFELEFGKGGRHTGRKPESTDGRRRYCISLP